MNGRFKVLITFITIGLVMFAQKYYTYDSSIQNSYVTEEYQSTGSTSKKESTGGICDQCKNKFIGRGYTEVSDGVWQETKEPYQSYICSRECGLKHTSKWHSILGKKDGKVYDKEPCGLCEGTGIEKNRSSMSSEYGRVCPQCDGKGYQSH
ncbi:hypothetical protein D3C87_255770 [compost metagenome]